MQDNESSMHPILDSAAIAAQLGTQHIADVVETLNALDPARAASALETIPLPAAIDILEQPGFDRPDHVIAWLPPDRAAALLGAMSADRRADIFRRLPEAVRSDLMGLLDAPIRRSIEQLLAYPPMSAGGIMTTEFVSMPATWTVEQALQHIRAVGGARETVYALYILDPGSQRLLRAISLRQLILSDRTSSLLEVGPPRKPITVTVSTDREDVARLISKYDLLAVPVVDDMGHVLGIVTVDDVIDAIVQESTEDVQKLGGVEPLEQPYMRIGLATMIKKRGGWLSALFLSEMLTASAMQSFQSELEKALILTLFIPLIMSSGGNSGSQATSLIVRALALRELGLADWWRIAIRELPAGAILGTILGVIGVARIVLWQFLGLYDYGPHWLLIAATVASALIGVVTFGSLSGSLLPFALKSVGFDPASASAPLVATLVDVTGLVIYFNVAYVILKGTLL
jgi:magnesium transporter